MSARTIRVLLADDQALVRGALAALLNLEPDIEVVAEVGRGDQVVAAARESQADIAMLDIEMPGLSGIDAAEESSGPRSPGAAASSSPPSAVRDTCDVPSTPAPRASS